MRWSPRGGLRWLVPGMRVKRWLLLSFVSMGAITVSFLYALGVEVLRVLYRAFPLARPVRYGLMGSLFALGVALFVFSILRLVRSVVRAVVPDAREKTSALVYRTRVLEKAPRVVAIGGGTGLSTLLRGLKRITANLTAVVAVMDDGGSSGRLRDEIDVLPPGDVRNCLLALAEDESRFADFFQHRFTAPGELAGHSLGNLVLAGLEQKTGSFDAAVEAMSHFLNVQGRVLPATLAKTRLVARMADGETLEGEARIGVDPRRIERLWLHPAPAPAYDRVLDALRDAHLILLGPGSLFTSLIPNLLVDGIAEALERSSAEKVLMANLMTQPGETTGLTLLDHLRVLNGYVNVSTFDLLLVNSARPVESLLHGYRSESAEPVRDDVDETHPYGLVVVREDLVGIAAWDGKTTIKHDPDKVAKAIVRHTQTFSRRISGEEVSSSPLNP
ncbi:MAG: uridine diphosphate-N-acetylglucosamine-binding protein YvcK [Candidatus Bipolaricaulota bacterium]